MDETNSRPRTRLRERMARGDSFGLLVLAVVVSYAILGFTPPSRWSNVLVACSFTGTFLLALHTSHVRGRVALAFHILAAVVLVNAVVTQALGVEASDGAVFLTILLPLGATVAVLRRIASHTEVTAETVLGGISVYLLLGVAFAAIYVALNELAPPFFAQAEPGRVEFLYFSFITLTTVGYGDLTPATDVGRTLATAEALIGQIYLVTVVAWLVSGFRGRAQGTTRKQD